MPLLSAAHLSMHFTGPLLLDDVTVDVEPGARIGVIGRNGSGKSTLLNILAGRLEPTAGGVVRQRGIEIAYQTQELEYSPDSTVYAEMRALFARETQREEELRALEEKLAQGGDVLTEYERLQHEQEAAGVYDIDRRIETMLSSLGLDEATWHRPIGEFSGGERNIIGLARVLLSRPDVMLLDEPSNHLDMDGVEWFIDFARRSDAAIVMVSHNRHLLDATTTEIWELKRSKVKRWTGNYSDFQQQKAEELALQERQFKTQQRLIQRIEFQARRLMDMANAYDDPGQARRAKAMLKRIDRMDVVERPDATSHRFRAGFTGGTRHGRIALQVKGFDFAYGDRVLFDKAELEIEYGDRVCLVGPNGSGKSTFMSAVLDDGGWDHPVLRLGKSVKVGDYRQFHDVLDADATLQEWMSRATGMDYPGAAALLYRFLFKRDDLERRIRTLSGGEKSRLQLARLVHHKVNFLLLDEPTNHLDIKACEQLEEMLQEFEGSLLIISHDRYFLDKLVNRVVEVRDLKLMDHRCSFAEWWRRRVSGRRKALEDRKHRSDKSEARREFEQRKERSRELSRQRSRQRELEARIEELEARQRDLKQQLEEAYSGAQPASGAADLSREFDALRGELADLYREWEAASAALES